jgi:molybdopterin-guanine dinucleotide biosynthesis protein A
VYGKLLTPVKQRPSASLAIIAGGRGSRLGLQPKGLIRLGNTTIVEHLLAVSPVHCCLINSNEAEPYAFLGLPIVGDVMPHRGAPGGVLTALLMAPTEWVLIAGCDMPYVTRDVMERLVAAAGPAVDVVCCARGGRLEPLLGLYRRALWAEWLQRIAAAKPPALRALVQGMRCTVLPVDDDSLLTSVNTPADLLQLRRTARAATN